MGNPFSSAGAPARPLARGPGKKNAGGRKKNAEPTKKNAGGRKKNAEPTKKNAGGRKKNAEPTKTNAGGAREKAPEQAAKKTNAGGARKKAPARRRRKKAIPPHVRQEVWRLYGGDRCWCCKSERISAKNKHFGHIVAERAGGAPTVENLRPICPGCNAQMGTRNMYEFMAAEGHPLCDAAAIAHNLRREPGLEAALRGREVFVVPAAAPPRRHDFLGRDELLAKYPFLARLAEKRRLSALFERAEHRGACYRFVLEPRYARWLRHEQEAPAMAAIGGELMGGG